MLIVELCDDGRSWSELQHCSSVRAVAITSKHPSYPEVGKVCPSTELQTTFLIMLENKFIYVLLSQLYFSLLRPFCN